MPLKGKDWNMCVPFGRPAAAGKPVTGVISGPYPYVCSGLTTGLPRECLRRAKKTATAPLLVSVLAAIRWIMLMSVGRKLTSGKVKFVFIHNVGA